MSKNTPKANVKRIKWAPKIVFFLVLGVSIVFLTLVTVGSGDNSSSKTASNGCNGLKTADSCIPLERADTNQSRIKGLSDRDSLAPNTGMLFVFDRPDGQCFWMKDMRFNLDIIWIDQQKNIVKLEQNVSPDSYPKSFCANNTQYVLELNSGEAQKLKLGLGQQLNF